MAQEDRSTAALTPEERLSQRVLERFGLSPPVPVEELLRDLAIVEVDDIPLGVDAVLVRSAVATGKPLVVLSKSKAPTRQRFTMAHEVGHILLPWHIGAISCHANAGLLSRFGDDIYFVSEAEANRFASELLMPIWWLRQAWDSANNNPAAFHRMVCSGAKVSPVAACFSAMKVLPPGVAFFVEGVDGTVEYTGVTKGVREVLPSIGQVLRLDDLHALGGAYTVSNCGRVRVHWWMSEGEKELVSSIDLRDSKAILRGIITETFGDNVGNVVHRINGIIGSANSDERPANAEQLFAVLRRRFRNRDPDVMECVKHAEFDLFLSRRAQEVIERRNQGGR